MISRKHRNLHDSPTEKYILIFTMVMMVLFTLSTPFAYNLITGYFPAVDSSESVVNQLPIAASISIISTNNYDAFSNLTAISEVSDPNGDDVNLIYMWYKDNLSISALNLPFHSEGAYDYSSKTSALVQGAIWDEEVYYFDGDDYITGINSNLSFIEKTGVFSITGWIKLDDHSLQKNQTIISRSAQGKSANFYYANSGGAKRELRLSFVKDGTTIHHKSNSNIINDNNWHFVAVIGNGNDVIFYIDNNFNLGSEILNPFSSEETYVTEIGRAMDNDYYSGYIDKINVYRVSLSHEQIIALTKSRNDLIVSAQTTVGENWAVEITPNDGKDNGIPVKSNAITINPINPTSGGTSQQVGTIVSSSSSSKKSGSISDSSSGGTPVNALAAPTVDTLVLNTTLVTSNNTNQNLTAYVTTSGDGSIKVIYNWLVNGTPISVLNMPFEKINETTTNNAWDYSGYGYNGSITGATWGAASGYDGLGAYDFDGSGDYIGLGNGPSIKGTDQFTVCAWFNASSINKMAIVNQRATGTAEGSYYFGINNDPVGKVVFEVYAGGSTGFSFNSNITVNDGNWHFACGVRTNSTDGAIFVEGNLDNTSSGDAKSLDNVDVVIGRWNGGGTYFNGTIDEVMLFNRSLSASQIHALYNNRTDLISSNETTPGDNWTVDATPNNGSEDGAKVRSNQVIVQSNNPPVVSVLFLNSTNPANNNTNQNLTANVFTSDGDSDSVKVIYNWLVNGTPLAVLNMPFEKVNGTTTNNAYDYSGYGNHGTEVNGVEWNSDGGYDGLGTYQFDGVDDYINLSNNPSLQINKNITLEAWVKTNFTPGTNVFPRIISKLTDSPYNGYELLIHHETGKPYVQIANANTVKTAFANSGLTVNKWTHVVGVYNGTDLKIFVDGVLQNEITAVTNGIGQSSTDVVIGKWAGGSGTLNWNGSIDEVRIWNKTISDEQVLALYNNRTDLIVSQETTSGQNWTVDATPNDGNEDGAVVRSNQIITTDAVAVIPNNLPVVNSLLLNSTDLTLNGTNENITANVSTSDGDSDSVKVIYNWLVNGTPLAVLNMPFEQVNSTTTNNAYDYSGKGYEGTVSGATWNATGGYDGNGAYEFDGITNHVNLSVISSSMNDWSLETWFKLSDDHNSSSTNSEFIYDSRNIAADTDSYLYFTSSNPGKLLFRNYNPTDNLFSATDVFYGDVWYHAIIVCEDNNVKKMYINGILENQSTAGCAHKGSTLGHTIGAYNSGGTAGVFNGTIDEVMIYNHSLSADQIRALFENRTDLITSSETTSGQNWTVDATPNDGSEDGAKVRSNQIITLGAAAVPNNLPVVNSLLLNTTDLDVNGTNENITANVSTSDGDSDSVKVIYNWLVNGTSLAVLNMPFEAVNGTNSSNAWDYSGYGNNGSENGATFNATGGSDGKGAYDFDGGVSNISISDNDNLDFGDNRTYNFWWKRSSSTTNQHLLGKVMNAAPWEGCALRYGHVGATNVNLKCYNSAGANDVNIDSSATISDANWHMITATFNSGTLTLYIDGTSAGTDTSFQNQYNSGTSLQIGYLANGWSGASTDGTMDEVMMWNRSLSAEQISAIFNNRTDLIVSQETTSGQNWTLDATPNDGIHDGAVVRSNQLITTDAVATVANNLPVVNTLLLNTTDLSLNGTNENITANVSTSDGDSDSVKVIYNWLVNGTPLAVLNMPFEAVNGTNSSNAWDYSGYGNNGSVTGATFNATGGYGGKGAYEFDGVDDYISAGTFNPSNPNNITLSAWIKKSSFSSSAGIPNDFIISKGHDFTGHSYGISTYSADSSMGNAVVTLWAFGGPLATVSTGSGLLTAGKWHNIVGTINGGNLSIYVDGVFRKSATKGFTLNTNANDVRIGNQNRATYTYYFNGSIDEPIIYDRALSAEQIKALYNNKTNLIVSQETTSGQNWTVDATPNDGTEDGAKVRSNQLITTDAVADSTSPTVTFVTPTNVSNYTVASSNQTFNVSVLEETIDSVLFSFNNASGTAFNVTATNGSGHWVASYNVSSLAEGTHTVTALANDTSGNLNNTILQTFIVDNTAPIATWTTPTNLSNYTSATYNVSFNFTSNELNFLQSALLSFDNASGNVFNITPTNDSGTWYALYNVSSLAEGTHTVTILVNDSVNNFNNTEQITFILDNTVPKVNITSPSSGAAFTIYSSNQTFNASIFELNFVQSVLFSFDNSSGTSFNLSGSNSSGYWFVDYNVSTLSNGSHIVTVLANDSSGNYNRTQSITFNVNVTPFVDVDSTSPTVSWITPTNVSNYTIASSNQTFNVSVFENNIANVLFSFDNSSGTSFNITAENKSGYWSTSYNVGNLIEGSHVVTVLANDSSGNYNRTEQITFILDNTVPKVNITNPSSGSSFSIYSSTQRFNASIFELNYAQSVLFSFDNSSGTSFNLSGSNSSGYWFVDYNVSTLSNGSHIVTVLANDSAGNYNRTQSITFNVNVTPFIEVDSTSPTVSWITPTNVSNYTLLSYNQTFNVSIFESDIANVLFSFDNSSGTSFNITAENKSGYWSSSYNVSNLIEGIHTVTVLANDSSGNLNNTEQITFILDNTAPKVNITSPSSGAAFTIYSSTQRFNASIFELNFVQSVLFSFDNSSGTAFNLTASNSSGYWFVDYNVSTLSNGSHIVTVLANDSSGNYNSTQTISFNVNVTPFVDVDTTSPTVSWITPTNDSYYSINSFNQTFNSSVLEANVDSVLFSFDNATGNSFNITATNKSGYWSTDYNVSSLIEGFHSVTIVVNDTSNNINNSVSIFFTTDYTMPSVVDLIPISGTSFDRNVLAEIAINLSDSSNISQAFANITYPNGSNTLLTLSLAVANKYNISFNTTSLVGRYNITFIINDTINNYNKSEITFFNVNTTDLDGDSIDDLNDTLVGNLTSINITGINLINITVGGNSTNGTFSGVQEVIILNNLTKIINFTHNFSASSIDLNKISIELTSTSLVVNMTGQLALNENKTLFLTNPGFTSLCVKDDNIVSASQISDSCNGVNETLFTSCLDGAYNASGITCVDNGTMLTIGNLQHSGIKGSTTTTASTTPTTDTASSGSSGGGSLPIVEEPVVETPPRKAAPSKIIEEEVEVIDIDEEITISPPLERKTLKEFIVDNYLWLLTVIIVIIILLAYLISKREKETPLHMLEDWIISARESNADLKSIKQKLKQHGWLNESIKEALERVTLLEYMEKEYDLTEAKIKQLREFIVYHEEDWVSLDEVVSKLVAAGWPIKRPDWKYQLNSRKYDETR
jgi:hypothetical protein